MTTLLASEGPSGMKATYEPGELLSRFWTASPKRDMAMAGLKPANNGGNQ